MNINTILIIYFVIGLVYAYYINIGTSTGNPDLDALSTLLATFLWPLVLVIRLVQYFADWLKGYFYFD